MHEQFPNSGKTSAPQVAAERLDRTGGAHSDPIDSDRDNNHVRELATSSDAALEAPVAPGPTPRLAAVIVLIVAIVVTAALLGLSYEPAESVATTRAPAALSGHPPIPGRANALEQGPVLRAKHGLTDGILRRAPDPAFRPTRHRTKCREKTPRSFFGLFARCVVGLECIACQPGRILRNQPRRFRNAHLLTARLGGQTVIRQQSVSVHPALPYQSGRFRGIVA